MRGLAACVLCLLAVGAPLPASSATARTRFRRARTAQHAYSEPDDDGATASDRTLESDLASAPGAARVPADADPPTARADAGPAQATLGGPDWSALPPENIVRGLFQPSKEEDPPGAPIFLGPRLPPRLAAESAAQAPPAAGADEDDRAYRGLGFRFPGTDACARRLIRLEDGARAQNLEKAVVRSGSRTLASRRSRRWRRATPRRRGSRRSATRWAPFTAPTASTTSGTR